MFNNLIGLSVIGRGDGAIARNGLPRGLADNT
jgi:hypothetical protein